MNVEVVSEEDGILQEQLSEGDTVEVGQAIAIVGEGKGSTSSSRNHKITIQLLKMKNTKQILTNHSTPRTSTEACGSDTSSNDDSESINNKRVNAKHRRHARKMVLI